MAFAFSKCAPPRRGEPSLHFIRALGRGRRGPLPQPFFPSLCGPRPLAPLSPRAHTAPAGPGAGAGPGAAEAAAGSLGRTTAQTLAAPVLRAAAGVGAGAGSPVRAPIFAPARPHAPAAPPSPDKQRPGAILGRGTSPAGEWALPSSIADPRRAGASGAPLAGLPGLGVRPFRSTGPPRNVSQAWALRERRGRPAAGRHLRPSPHILGLPAERGQREC